MFFIHVGDIYCMDYKKIHDNIIKRAINRDLTGYCEKHHIIPRCMGGLNDKLNLVKLTAKEHWLIHLLLIEIYPKNNKLKVAIRCMMWKSNSHTRKKVSSGKQFERLRLMAAEAHGNLLRGKKRKPFSEEHKNNISQAKIGKVSNRKGVTLSDKTKEKIGKASLGRIDGDKNPMKKPEQKKRMLDNNPMRDEKVLENFKGDKNPNAKQVRVVSSNEIFKTINECTEKLEITKGKFYNMVKHNLILYI